MDPRLAHGVFVGYKLGLGSEEVDQYLFRSIDDFIGKNDFRRISPNVTRVIEFDSERGVHFPLKAACQLYFGRSLRGHL
jgi:hypothetical protein